MCKPSPMLLQWHYESVSYTCEQSLCCSHQWISKCATRHCSTITGQCCQQWSIPKPEVIKYGLVVQNFLIVHVLSYIWMNMYSHYSAFNRSVIFFIICSVQPSALLLPSFLRQKRMACNAHNAKRPKMIQSWDRDIVCHSVCVSVVLWNIHVGSTRHALEHSDWWERSTSAFSVQGAYGWQKWFSVHLLATNW